MTKIERNTDVKIKCYKCGNEYTMDFMRMDSNGKNLVCKNCLDRRPVAHEKKLSAETSSQKPAKKAEEPQMKEYFCKDCKYSFKRSQHLVISACPYCDSSEVITKGSTARIISDAFRMKGVD